MELHVLYVPDDYWDVKLHKVPAEAIERFISAGFIRYTCPCAVCTVFKRKKAARVENITKLDICKWHLDLQFAFVPSNTAKSHT